MEALHMFDIEASDLNHLSVHISFPQVYKYEKHNKALGLVVGLFFIFLAFVSTTI